jgi:hypothetical protein
MKVRIIERISPSGYKQFVIQQKHFLFRWWWVDGWTNSIDTGCVDSFSTLEEAERNLCYFDGTKTKENVVYEMV